jgi:hypothetical protein
MMIMAVTDAMQESSIQVWCCTQMQRHMGFMVLLLHAICVLHMNKWVQGYVGTLQCSHPDSLLAERVRQLWELFNCIVYV